MPGLYIEFAANHSLNGSLFHLRQDLEFIHPCKGVVTSQHVQEYHGNREDVSFATVSIAFENLGSLVAVDSHHFLFLHRHNCIPLVNGLAEIADLNFQFFSDENIRGLQIAMYQSSLVDKTISVNDLFDELNSFTLWKGTLATYLTTKIAPLTELCYHEDHSISVVLR